MILGSHLSTSGGLYKAVDKAADYGFDTVALFVRNQRQWQSRPLSADDVAAFKQSRKQTGIRPIVAHGSYLLNLAGESDVRKKSIVAFSNELERCEQLGIEYYVFHPGANPDTETGIALVADGLNNILADQPKGKTIILLETTAGQGHSVGCRFEHLAGIRQQLDTPRRVGVCLDTCHIFAAGYDIRTPAAYAETMEAFDNIVGMKHLRAIHLNDSLRDYDSHVDRHAPIGRGAIGRKGFANFVRDTRLANTPMIMETPKGFDERGRDWDTVNAAVLRRLARSTKP